MLVVKWPERGTFLHLSSTELKNAYSFTPGTYCHGLVVTIGDNFTFLFPVILLLYCSWRVGVAQSVYQLSYGLDGPRIESQWGRDFPYRPIPRVLPASYTTGTGSFLGVKRPKRGVDHPPRSSAEVKERVEPHLYSPSGPSWPVLR